MRRARCSTPRWRIAATRRWRSTPDTPASNSRCASATTPAIVADGARLRPLPDRPGSRARARRRHAADDPRRHRTGALRARADAGAGGLRRRTAPGRRPRAGAVAGGAGRVLRADGRPVAGRAR
ncbi:MAG: hypothetical protein MZW92_19260 [Comamonadaceae bacterium]|nr:hypothetical protein [Comamonadaceae bacterium]